MSPEEPLDGASDPIEYDAAPESEDGAASEETSTDADGNEAIAEAADVDEIAEAADIDEATENETAEEVDPTSIANIERMVLDREELVQALAYNGQEDIGRKGKAVFSLTPPFGDIVEPTLRHLEDDSTVSTGDDDVHLRPFRFVVDGRQVIDQRPTRQLAVEKLDGDDHDEAVLDAWVDEAMGEWKRHIRENLAPSVDIFSPHGMAIVDVEYGTESVSEPDT